MAQETQDGRDDGDALARIEAALALGRAQDLPDDLVRRALSAAVRAYAAKAEHAEREPPPLEAEVTATDAVTTVCAMVRAVDLNMFDVTMWFNRSGGRG
ncbi:MAG TPA: hypothetical protein VIL72_12160 [Beijerinckiaceae bacterium]